MESDGTDISTSSVPHEHMYIRMYMCRHHYDINSCTYVCIHTCADNKRVVTLMIHTIKRFTQLKYKCPCLLCPCSRCDQRGHKTHIRQAANNAGQPCQWPLHQIHRISRGTAPWTTDQNRLQGARLCVRHHQSQ